MGVVMVSRGFLANVVMALPSEAHLPAAGVLARCSLANALAVRHERRDRTKMPHGTESILEATRFVVLHPEGAVGDVERLEGNTRLEDGRRFLHPESARGLRLLRLAVGLATDTVVRLGAADLASIVAVVPPEVRGYAADRLQRISFINMEARTEQIQARGVRTDEEQRLCTSPEILAAAEGLPADPVLAEWVAWLLGRNTLGRSHRRVGAAFTSDTLGEIRDLLVQSENGAKLPLGAYLPPGEPEYDAASVAIALVREAARSRSVEERLQTKGIGLDTPQVAREIRREIGEAVASGKLPRARYSVRARVNTTHAAITVTATNLPFDVLLREAFVVREGDADLTFDRRNYVTKYTTQALLVLNKLNAIVDGYHWDSSDLESDGHNARFSWSVTVEENATAWATFTAAKVAQARAEAEPLEDGPIDQDEPTATA
ncbi:hypothetical protein LZC95_19635 [Pendulispora brunnea]|uniref:Uncharacterized protein n=1 Tax=Pendulispora brunnea TaxID=2905690 RepID=A0ABZ2KPN3_9BACT